MDRALADVTVVDLTRGIAGPFCTKVLAGLGAEVIKVEPPCGGDPARHAGPFLHDQPDPETSALFLSLNGGKKSLTLDLRTAVGAAIVRELATTADILVESSRPDTMERRGLGFEALHAVNPRLVYVSISNFGQTGPYRDYKGFDMLFFAMGGEMASTGLPDRGPIRLGNDVMQHQAGNLAAAAALIAYHGVQEGGPGQQVDVSIFESAVSSADRRIQYLLGYAYNRTIPDRRDQVWAIYPTGVYPCRDGFIEIFGGGPNFFPRTCRMMGQPELVDDPRFATPEALIDPERKGEFDTIFVPWVLEHTRAEIMAAAQRESVYCAPILTPEDVYHDPHYQARGFFRDVRHPRAGTLRCPGAPAQMSATPWSLGPAPLLGEHNGQVLMGRLGYSAGDLVRLRRAGVL